MLALNTKKSFEKRLLKAIDDGNPRQLLAFFREYPEVSDITLLKSLHEAVLKESVTLVQIILAAGVDLPRADSQHTQQILVSAIRTANIAIIRLIIDEGINMKVDQQTFHEHTPLQAVIYGGHEEIFDLLVSSGCSLSCRDIDGMTALHTVPNAIFAEKMLQAGASIDSQCSGRGLTPLHTAVDQGWTEVVTVFVKSGADVIIPEKRHGYIPLHTAMVNGDSAIIDILLQRHKEEQVNAITNDGQNCLHLLVKHCSYPSLKCIVDAGCCTDVQDKSGLTPLMLAVQEGKMAMAADMIATSSEEELLKSFIAQDNGGNTVFHLLSSNNNFNEEQQILLLQCKDIALLGKKNRIGKSPLMIASSCGNTNVVDLLLMKGVDVNANHGVFGSSLHLAIANGHNQVAQTLLQVGELSLDTCDSSGETVLHKAALFRNSTLLNDILCNHKSSRKIVNFQNKSGFTALHYLMQKSSPDVDAALLNKLVEIGGSVNLHNKEGDTPLLTACKCQVDNLASIAEIVKLGAEVNAVNKEGKSALHIACINRRRELAEFLVDHGCDCGLQDNTGATPLHSATALGLEGLIYKMIKTSPKTCRINCIGNLLKTVLYQSVELGLSESFSLFLENGALPDVEGSISSPLIVAAESGQVVMVQKLLEHRADVNKCDGKYRRTALVAAAGNGHLDCVQLLLNNNVDIQIKDRSGDSALTRAAWGGHTDTVKLLLPLYPDIDHTEREEGMSALYLAIAREHIECVEVLLAAGADVNLVDHHGNTALLTAAMLTSGTRTLELVLACDQGYDINAVGDKGRTALHWAVGEPESVGLLLWYEPHLDILDENMASPLLLAIAHKQPESAKLLINTRCSINMVHNDGRCPIHHAAVYGDHETTQLLLEHGIHPDTPMEDGRQPLLIAAIENHTNVLETLLKYAVDIDHIYYDSFTALSTAVSNRHMASTLVLLNHGANPDRIGSQKHLPLIHAILTNFVPGIVALIQAGSDFDAGLEDDKHALQVSGMKNNAQVTHLLLAAGCNPSNLRYIMEQGIVSYYLEDEDLLGQMEYLSREPWSLCVACRAVLRHALRRPLTASIQQTLLPQPLKDFILYAELNHLLFQ